MVVESANGRWCERCWGEALARSNLTRSQISIRLVWPFARLLIKYPQGLASLSKVGIRLAEYADPETRLPLADVVDLLNESIRITGDPALGLRAGELIEAGDFDVLECAARSCSNLRGAIDCLIRYARLMSDAAEVNLIVKGNTSIVRYDIVDAVPIPPAVNDYVITALINHMRQQTGGKELAHEIRFTHAPTSYLDEYQRVFRTKVVFNQKHNEIRGHPSTLNTPLIRANPRLFAAFELHARRLLQALQQKDNIGDKTRAAVLARLKRSEVDMPSVARALSMSVATLRRRLAEENLTFKAIVEELRIELAQRYLSEPGRSIREVAFLLGFSDNVSFNKAFKRWTGMTPSDFRARMNSNRVFESFEGKRR